MPHPYSCFRSVSVGGSVAPGESSAGLSAGLLPPGSFRRSVRSCPPAPARPISALACLAFRRYRCSFSVRPAPPYQCFRSVGFRRPREAVEDSDRRMKRVHAPPGITIRGFCACVPAPAIRRASPIRSINRCYVARSTAAASGGAPGRLTPPPSDGGQRKIYVYLTAYQSDTFKTVFIVNLTFRRRSRPDPSMCLRHGRRLAPPASFVYIRHVSSQRPTVSVSETLGSFVYGYYFINRNWQRSKIGGCAHLSTHSRANDRLAASRD